jgi:hypothetical protein
MSTRKNKANPNMARSKKTCAKAAKARWIKYYEMKKAFETYYSEQVTNIRTS